MCWVSINRLNSICLLLSTSFLFRIQFHLDHHHYHHLSQVSIRMLQLTAIIYYLNRIKSSSITSKVVNSGSGCVYRKIILLYPLSSASSASGRWYFSHYFNQLQHTLGLYSYPTSLCITAPVTLSLTISVNPSLTCRYVSFNPTHRLSVDLLNEYGFVQFGSLLLAAV